MDWVRFELSRQQSQQFLRMCLFAVKARATNQCQSLSTFPLENDPKRSLDSYVYPQLWFLCSSELSRDYKQYYFAGAYMHLPDHLQPTEESYKTNLAHYYLKSDVDCKCSCEPGTSQKAGGTTKGQLEGRPSYLTLYCNLGSLEIYPRGNISIKKLK